jgi:hypothetical protein
MKVFIGYSWKKTHLLMRWLITYLLIIKFSENQLENLPTWYVASNKMGEIHLGWVKYWIVEI